MTTTTSNRSTVRPAPHGAPDTQGATASTVATKPDFPLYNGDPVQLSGRGWAVLMGSVLVGAACDLFVEVPGPAWLSVALRGVLFAGIPLATLSRLAPGVLGRMFRTMRPRAGLLAAGIAVVNVIVSFIVGSIVTQLVGTNSNPMGADIASAGLGDRILTFASMVPQLIGEEVFTILPLLAVLTLATSVWHLSRRSSLILAVVVSSVAFAMLHLPTYGWNVLQCLAVIGIARVVLLVPYLVTKNVTASATAHVLNDWTMFGVGLIGA